MKFNEVLELIKLHGNAIGAYRQAWRKTGNENIFLIGNGAIEVPANSLDNNTFLNKSFLESIGVEAVKICLHFDLFDGENLHVGFPILASDAIAEDWEVVGLPKQDDVEQQG